MVKRIIIRTLFIVFFFCFFVLYLAPANKLLSIVDIPKNVKLYGVRGDLWEGAIDTIDVNKIRVNNINWKLNIFTLIFAKGISVSVNDSKLVNGQFDLNIFDLQNEISLSSIELKTKIEKVLPFVKLPLAVKAKGIVQSDFSHLVLDKHSNIKSIKGKIFAKDVIVYNPFNTKEEIDIGKIELDIKNLGMNSAILEINLEQDSAIFKIPHMKISVLNMKQIKVEGLIRPKGDIPESVAMVFNMIGKPDADGNIKVSYKGNL